MSEQISPSSTCLKFDEHIGERRLIIQRRNKNQQNSSRKKLTNYTKLIVNHCACFKHFKASVNA